MFLGLEFNDYLRFSTEIPKRHFLSLVALLAILKGRVSTFREKVTLPLSILALSVVERIELQADVTEYFI